MQKIEPFRENILFHGLQTEASQFNACVGTNGGPYDLFDYSKGYFEATRFILERMKERPGDFIVDLLVYPACYSLRHAVELFVKYLIVELSRATGGKQKYESNHSIVDNWRLAADLIGVARMPHKEADLAFTAHMIEAISEVDPNGQIFRYPDSIKGDQHLIEWKLINLSVIDETRQKLQAIFQDWRYAILDLID